MRTVLITVFVMLLAVSCATDKEYLFNGENLDGWIIFVDESIISPEDFFYVKDKARVNCMVVADSTDPGRGVEITLVKNKDRWLIKRFDLK